MPESIELFLQKFSLPAFIMRYQHYRERAIEKRHVRNLSKTQSFRNLTADLQ